MALLLVLLLPLPALPVIWLGNRVLARTERFALAELIFWISSLLPILLWLGYFTLFHVPTMVATGVLPSLDLLWPAMAVFPVLPMTLLTLFTAYRGARRGEGYRRV